MSVCDVHVNWGMSVQERFKEHTTIKYRGRKCCSSLVLHNLLCTITRLCFTTERKDTLWHPGKLHPGAPGTFFSVNMVKKWAIPDQMSSVTM